MDMLLLHALANRKRYNLLRHAVPQAMLSPETYALLAWYQVYYSAFPEREGVVVDELKSLIKMRAAGSPDQLALTLTLVEKLNAPVDESAINGIVGQLHELDLSGRAAALITKYNNGEEVDLAYELAQISQATLRQVSQATPDSYIDTPIDEILTEISNDRGLKFTSMKCLHDNVAGLSGGASVAIGARPDKGKTSAIARILCDFAPQVREYFGPGRPILWFNNEGSGKRIIPRIYQAALRLDLPGITKLSNEGVLVQQYTEAIGGDATLIRVKDMHGATLAKAAQVIEQVKPCIVVWDMLANFHMAGGAGANKADMVEQLWQGARELAVTHDFVSLATVQISQEGGNMLFPPYSALKDSKTGIQGATDLIVMIGSMDSPDVQFLRGFSTPKNKFAIAGRPSYITAQMDFDAATVQFTDKEGT